MFAYVSEVAREGHTSHNASRHSARLPIQPQTMFTITLTFSLLVALWGFSATIASFAKRTLANAKPPGRPSSGRDRAPQARGSRPVASA